MIAELETEGALTAGLNYYRANVPPESYVRSRRALPPVAAPTMGMWNSADPFLVEAQMAGSGEHVGGPWRYERLEGPGHWMPLDAPAAVNELLVDFLPAGS